MRKLALLLVLFVITEGIAKSQKSGETQKLIQLSEKFIAEENYSEAIKICDKLIEDGNKSEENHFNLGICKFNTADYLSAKSYFDIIINNFKTTQKKTNYTLTSYYYKVQTLHKLYLFDEELALIEELEKLGVDKKMQNQLVLSKKTAENAKDIYATLTPIVVTRLAILNSEFDDHTPIPSYDGMKLFFTSKRTGSTGGDILSDENKLYEDIWLWDKNKGLSKKPVNIGNTVNTPEHDATCGLSPDGNTLFIYKSGKKNPGDIWKSNYVDSAWSMPEILNENINNKKSSERHISITSEGNKIYFSSERKGGKGQRDIWESEKVDSVNWKKPVNININTPFDEEAPYILPDGKSMYFSSKGYNTMGGYDIFKVSRKDDNTWDEPQNVGFPINTVEDDVFYFPMKDEKIAYFTRKNQGQSDIYKVFIWGETEKYLMVEGIVYNIENKTNDISLENTDLKDSTYFVPKDATVSVIDIRGNVFTDIYDLNSGLGDYKFVVIPEKKYKIEYDAPNHIFDTKDIYSDKEYADNRLKYNSKLVKIISGETYKSKKLYFSPNELTIKDFNLKEIELIANALKEYPELTVNFSNSDYLTENKNPVSNQIKNSAVELIKKLGIDETRIFTDLSPDSIENNVLQYTIFDKISVQNAIAEKANRLNQDYVSKIKDVTFTAENILFEFAQNTVKIDANPELNKLAEYLTKNPESVIQITAYADAVGNTDFNKKLSEKRALMIQNYLISKGVGKNQTTIRGSGEENPLTLNMINGQWNENSKRFNRRAEFKVIKQGTQTIKIVQFQNIPEEYKNPNYNSEY